MFDPNTLTPLTDLTPLLNPSNEEENQNGQPKPQIQWLKNADGQTVRREVSPTGQEVYSVQEGDGKTATFFAKKEDGSFTEGVTHTKRSGWDTVFKDEKLMGFLAVAGAGIAASAYAGAGAAGTSGMSAGEIAALEAGDVAIGGGGVASNTVPGVLSSSGAVVTPVTQGAIEVGAAVAPGAVTPAASTAASTVADASWFANSAADAAAYEGMTNGIAPASSWWSQTLGWAQKNPQIAGGIISGIGQAYAAHQRDGGKGDEMALLNRRIEAEAAENDKQRAHAGRNFQGSSYAKIDWGERPNLTTEMPVMRNTGPSASNALNTKTSQLGVLERRRRDGR